MRSQLSRPVQYITALAGVALLGVVALSVSASAGVAAPSDELSRTQLRQELGSGARIAYRPETGKVRFIGSAPGKPISRPSGLSPSASPTVVARAFLDIQGKAFGISDQAKELTVISARAASAGRSVVRFQQTHEGVPVLGGELVANLDSSKNLLSVGGETVPAPNVSVKARIDSSAASDAALEAVAKAHSVPASKLQASKPSLWIYDSRILGGPGLAKPTLVWRIDVTGEGGLEPIDELVLVDAQLGIVALHFSQIETAKYRQVCDANNTDSRVPCTTPFDRVEGGAASTIADVNGAYDNAGATYDFYLNYLGRDGIDGAGMTIKSTTRYCDPSSPCPFENAYWDGEQMVYGQGYASADDVVGHELTHGVTDHTSKLFYYYQSGAINESLSDTFGEFVDLTDGIGNDAPSVRWKLGEDLPGGAIRDMKNPPLYGQPDTMTSSYYTADPGGSDSGGVHTNSGVNNKAAFLITDGGSFNGKTVTGLGITKAAKIYYEVETNLLTSASDYADLYSALQQACTNLVGSAGITSSDCTQVTNAVDAVEMNVTPPAAPAPEAPVCSTGQSPHDLFFDNLENTASGSWIRQLGSGLYQEWFYPQNPNDVGQDMTYATSGTTNFWGYDQEYRADYSIAMTSSVAIPVGSTPYLRFNHSFGFENGAEAYDGGVLEYSTNGGASWADAGSLLTSNGYNGTISSNYQNPLGGRSAFVRESNGYISSRASLASLAGQSVRFRFRIGTDISGSDYGWFVDDIRVYTCSATPTFAFSSPTYSVGEAGPTASVTINRTGSTTGTDSVHFSTADGTATAGSDYTAVSQDVSFSPGETAKTISIPITDDSAVENDETVSLALSSPSAGAMLGDPNAATLTIADNDVALLALSQSSYSVGEAGPSASITINRSRNTASAVSVHFATADGTATAGSDYTTVNQDVSFAAGETSKTVVVPITDDSLIEGNETVSLTLSGPSAEARLGSPSTATLTIVDDDRAFAFSSATYSVGEAGPTASVTINRIGSTAATDSVHFSTADGTATAGSDYTSVSQDVSFSPGESSKTVSIPITDDAAYEGNETVSLSLSIPSAGAALGDPHAATLTIVDNDAALLAFSAASYSVGEAGPTASVTINRSGAAASAFSVHFATTSDGTATAGSDYTAVSQTVSFAPGVTSQTVSVPITDDAVIEADETVSLSLSSPSAGATLGSPQAAVLIIVDNDRAFAFSAASYSVKESGVVASITIARSGVVAAADSVHVATANGTASAGSDYTAVNQTVSFAAGEYFKTVSVPISNDKLWEGSETLTLTLSSPSAGASLRSPSIATLTIINSPGIIVSARPTKTSFKISQARKVKVVVKFSPASRKFNYLLSVKKGAKWVTVRNVKKSGNFAGRRSMTVKALFGTKAIKSGRYRVKLTADANSKTSSFKVT